MASDRSSTPSRAAKLLLTIPGVYAAAARGYAKAPKTEVEIFQTAVALFKIDVTASEVIPPDAAAYLERERSKARAILEDAAVPRPAAMLADTEDIQHYLRCMMEMLAHGFDARVDARVGEIRFAAECWDETIVAIAIPVHDPGNKSLARALRRVQKQTAADDKGRP